MNILLRGYYVQNGSKHQMNFGTVVISDGGEVYGKGNDEVGDFIIKGNIQGNPN